MPKREGRAYRGCRSMGEKGLGSGNGANPMGKGAGRGQGQGCGKGLGCSKYPGKCFRAIYRA